MKWTVIWLDEALDELARHFTPLWGTPAGAAVTRAMAQVDVRLETNAGLEGESRAGHARVLFEPPLTVVFQAFDEQRVAIVTHLGYTPAK